MPDARANVTAFETRLAAMDRRLRELQEELVPGSGGAGVPVGEPEPPPPREPEQPEQPEPVRLRAADPPRAPAAAPPGFASAPPGFASAPPGPATAPPGYAGAPELEMLAQLYTSLITSMRELLGGYETVAGRIVRTAEPPSEPARAAAAAVTVSAGPFAGTGDLHEFERALSELPGVRAVALRGYEEGDRAIVEVQLG